MMKVVGRERGWFVVRKLRSKRLRQEGGKRN